MLGTRRLRQRVDLAAIVLAGVALGREEKRVTVLFGDVRWFTTLSEGLAPGVCSTT